MEEAVVLLVVAAEDELEGEVVDDWEETDSRAATEVADATEDVDESAACIAIANIKERTYAVSRGETLSPFGSIAVIEKRVKSKTYIRYSSRGPVKARD